MINSWIHENHTEGYEVRWRITDIVHTEKTRFQELAVVDTLEWGRALFLDGALQVAEKDEFIYHEMISHVPLNAHPHPERVLIIGGGDGGTLREVVKHQRVQHVDLVEIDERVVHICKEYFPDIASSFEDNRVNLHIGDGIEFVKKSDQKYDLVIVDSSDPVGPAVALYSKDFYNNVYCILNDTGMINVQSESPIFFPDAFKNAQINLRAIFPIVGVYMASIATYVSGPWTFTIGSKKYNPEKIGDDSEYVHGLKYYSDNIHVASFCMPQFIKNMIE